MFAVSDLHLFHANIIRGGKIAIRPFDTLEAMHERIIDGWNSVVKPNDKVYMLGDLTLWRAHKTRHAENAEMWAGLCSVVNRLRGKKRMLLGNHDHLPYWMYEALGFEKVLAYRVLAGMILSHIPVHPSQFSRFKANVHGHTHENSIKVVKDWEVVDRPQYVNVCVEALDYVPISLEEIQVNL